MNESLVKYLAGLLDADGCLSFGYTRDKRNPDHYTVGLELHLGASTAIDRHGFVASLPELTGFGSINSPHSYAGNGKYVNWAVHKRSDLEQLLPRLIKHMVVKARHWHWIFAVFNDIRSRPYGERFLTGKERDILEQAKKDSRKFRSGPLKPKKHPTWAWVAGFLDGDGYYLHRNPGKGRYEICVGACAHITDVVSIELLHKAFGGKITKHSQSENLMEWKRSLSNTNRSFALGFLPKIVKHARLKRHKIEQIIHYHQQRLSGQGSTEQATV